MGGGEEGGGRGRGVRGIDCRHVRQNKGQGRRVNGGGGGGGRDGGGRRVGRGRGCRTGRDFVYYSVTSTHVSFSSCCFLYLYSSISLYLYI